MNEFEVYKLLKSVGLNHCPAFFLPENSGTETEKIWAENILEMAQGEGKFILKVVGRDILHKTDVGGVQIVDLAGLEPADVLNIVGRMKATLEEGGLSDVVEGFLAASFVPHKANTPGQEVLLSLKQDEAFGPCVVVGIGGTLTEWYGKGSGGSSTLIFPALGLEPEAVAAAIEAHPLISLFCCSSRLYRTAPVLLEDLVTWVMALAKLGIHSGPQGKSPFTVEEIEINPAVASKGRLVALDGVGLVSRRKWASQTRPVEKISPLLSPRSAVVLGVSAKAPNPGRIILGNLKRSEGIDQKRLYVVHHKEDSISGVPCYPSVADIPEKCDLAVISVPAQGALETITQLVELDKAQAMILIPGGFAEAGEVDLAQSIEDVLLKGHSAGNGGPVMVGGNCLGIVSRDNYNTFFLPDYKLPFNPGLGENLALVSQSGAYLVTFASNYDGVINPRASISFGNQMDLTVSDFLEFFAAVPEVDVIACYVEGFRSGDGQRFVELARQAADQGQKVIIFKAGKTPLGAKAAASHTASLAGDYAVAKACLESGGVTLTDTLSRFEDAIKTFTLLGRRSVGQKRVGIISNAGFECSTVTDNLGSLVPAVFDEKTQATLDGILPSFAHRSNPIDCTPMTGTDAFVASCEAILASPSVDVAILASVPVTPSLNNLPPDPAGSHQEDMTNPDSQPAKMIEIIRSSPKPAVVVVDSGRIYDPMCRMIEEAGIPVFRKIDRAACALDAFCRSEGAM
ncbi:MAG: acetate--CoA ligase family protein [Gemmatimonadales bacterium]|nr:acetate--CoA ligase family protein [Gemmatimonadales bacterium]